MKYISQFDLPIVWLKVCFPRRRWRLCCYRAAAFSTKMAHPDYRAKCITSPQAALRTHTHPDTDTHTHCITWAGIKVLLNWKLFSEAVCCAAEWCRAWCIYACMWRGISNFSRFGFEGRMLTELFCHVCCLFCDGRCDWQAAIKGSPSMEQSVGAVWTSQSLCAACLFVCLRFSLNEVWPLLEDMPALKWQGVYWSGPFYIHCKLWQITIHNV